MPEGNVGSWLSRSRKIVGAGIKQAKQAKQSEQSEQMPDWWS